MIKNIKIKNFQSHQNTNIEFCEGVNAIVGKTDSGKTAVIRALDFILNNNNTGDGYINHNSDIMEVEVETGDGHKIKRVKGKSKNFYFLDGEEFSAFGRNVPDEIKSVLNFDSINFQNQFSEHFLLADSPGERARFLNKAINLDVIDSSLKSIEKIKRKFNSDLKIEEEKLEEFKKQLSELEWLGKFKKEIDDIQKKYSYLQELKDKKNNLVIEIDKIVQYKNNLKEIEKISGAEKEIGELLENFNDFNIKNEMKRKLYLSIKKIKEFNEIKNNLEKTIKAETEINVFIQKFSDLSKRNSWANDFEKNILKAVRFSGKLSDKKEKLNVLKKEYEEYKKDIEVCPVCGKEMD